MKNMQSAALGLTLTLALALAACDVTESVGPMEDGLPPPQMGIVGPADVVIIGGAALDLGFGSYYCYPAGSGNANVMAATGGGCLPVQGPGLTGAFTFAPLPASAITAAALSAYDIAVLNMATAEIHCSAAVLSDQAKLDLIAFAEGGKKLIIYDSECYPGPVDYSWLPFQFTTSNPGARGSRGPLTIVEDNTLSSSDGSDPYFIDAVQVGSLTDAVGDMNVMTTYNANWCLDMSGTNILGVTGPVHTYAKYPAGTDHGLFIYNGLDMDFMYLAGTGLYPGAEGLYDIWKFELMQPFDPSDLPCGYTVVGITLTPDHDENNVGEDHTVTAALADLLGNPKSGIEVTFSVLSGPNASETGTATTGIDGQASFTYTGDGGAGDDVIQACFTDTDGEHCSQTVTKSWVIVNVPPSCGAVSVAPALTAVGTSVSATGSFTDVGDPGPWSIRWTWGDGTYDEYSVTTAGTVGPDAHTYAGAGVYPVDLAVTDPAGETCGDRFEYVVVYDPDAGFVTGGGWIDSPAGAYTPDPSLTGKATFGFVAKYKKGASTPDGNTEFQFHAADLNFHSSAYEWLVVTGSDYARFKGSGTINGGLCSDGDPYRFHLWAGDGDPDTFRIRIWCEDEATGVETDVYDNAFDQPISGGSIVIHTK